MRVEVELAHDTLYIPRVSRMVQEESILLQIAPNDRNVAFRCVDKELQRQYWELKGPLVKTKTRYKKTHIRHTPPYFGI